MSRQKILVVEDEPEIRHLVRLHLEDAGFAVSSVADGSQGLERALGEEWQLLVLDLSLPRVDGMEICRQVRQRDEQQARCYTPILMLTARSSELDRVEGLESGADDYLTKPFAVRELVARVRAVLRRFEASRQQPAEEEPLEFRGLRVDPVRRQVTVAGAVVHLTAKEFDLLWFFASQPGRVFDRSELLDKVWGYGHDGYEHTVNSHINRLRAKIERDPAQPEYVRTVWGVGYRFCEPHELEKAAS